MRGGGGGGEGGEVEGKIGMEFWPVSCSSGEDESEDMTIGRRRVALRFCRGIGGSGSESEEISMTAGFARCAFRGFCASTFFLLCLGREGKGDVVTGLTCVPVFETRRSFATVLPSSSMTMISTSTTGEDGGFLANFVGGRVACLDSTLTDTAGTLGANGRRTGAGPSIGFDVRFFFVTGFFLTTGETTFRLIEEGRGEESEAESSSTMVAAGGEVVVLPLVAVPKTSRTTILWERFP